MRHVRPERLCLQQPGITKLTPRLMGIEWQLSEKRFSSIHLGLFVRARQAWSLGAF
jgi:hypothetical protein